MYILLIWDRILKDGVLEHWPEYQFLSIACSISFKSDSSYQSTKKLCLCLNLSKRGKRYCSFPKYGDRVKKKEEKTFSWATFVKKQSKNRAFHTHKQSKTVILYQDHTNFYVYNRPNNKSNDMWKKLSPMLDSSKKMTVLLAFSCFPTYTDSLLLPGFPLSVSQRLARTLLIR